MSKKIVFLLIGITLTLLLVGCGGIDLTMELLEPESKEENIAWFEDDDIKIIFYPEIGFDLEGIIFNLENKTNSNIEIIWDEIVIIDQDNTPYNVFHEGIKYINKESSMKNTMLPPGTQKTDTIIPVDKVYWNGDYWDNDGITDRSNMDIGDYVDIKLILPLLINEEKHSYEFKFRVIKIKR